MYTVRLRYENILPLYGFYFLSLNSVLLKDSILLTGGAAGLKKVASSRKAAALSDIQNSASLQTLPAASAKGMSSKVINDTGSLDKAVFESL